MNAGETLILGIDRVKEEEILERAYNDKRGVTTAFNKNIIRVLNAYLQSGLSPEDFKHIAFYNRDLKRIEMHLEALKEMRLSLPGGRKIVIKKGERIHTENSYKFDRRDIENLASQGQFIVKGILSDEREWFSLVAFQKSNP